LNRLAQHKIGKIGTPTIGCGPFEKARNLLEFKVVYIGFGNRAKLNYKPTKFQTIIKQHIPPFLWSQNNFD
jgi:hypothetical protein